MSKQGSSAVDYIFSNGCIFDHVDYIHVHPVHHLSDHYVVKAGFTFPDTARAITKW